jgi:hypothetical protein
MSLASSMAHSGTSSLLAIEKLQGQTNYHQWRVSAEAVLRREQLWGIVSGRNPRRSLDQNDNEKLEEWDDSDDKAIGTLILSMIPTVQTKFIGRNRRGPMGGHQGGIRKGIRPVEVVPTNQVEQGVRFQANQFRLTSTKFGRPTKSSTL